MPDEKPKEKEQGGEPKAPEVKAPEPAAKGDKMPEVDKAQLESQVAGLRAEMERIRGNNREQAAKIAALEAPPAPEPAEEPEPLERVGDMAADEAVMVLANDLRVVKAQLAEAQEDKRHAALTAQIQDVQKVVADYGFEPLTREQLAELLEQTEAQGYSRLRVAWKELNEAAIKEKLLLKGAAERTAQDAIGDQAKSEAAAPSLNAVGQGAEDAQAKKLLRAAQNRGIAGGLAGMEV